MSKEMLKFSIIVRIYNAEKYISRQIESIISQAYSNWELILVNDGSIDSSGEICDRYSKKYNNIRVIHQNNSGCTCATIKGLQIANGDYCLAIDADDWLDNNLLEIANSYLEGNNYDILEYGIRIIKNNSIFQTVSYVKKETDFTQGEFLKFTWETTLHSLCTKFIRRNILNFTQNEIEYFTKNKINQNEDMLISIPYILCSNKIKVIPDCMYNYIIYEDSISHGINHVKKIQDGFETCNMAYKLIEERGISNSSIRKFIVDELQREIMPIIPSAILHKKLNHKIVSEMKKKDIYKFTKVFITKYGIKSFFAWLIFRII